MIFLQINFNTFYQDYYLDSDISSLDQRLLEKLKLADFLIDLFLALPQARFYGLTRADLDVALNGQQGANLPNIQAVTFRGKNIFELLRLNLQELADFFVNHRAIANKLELLIQLGFQDYSLLALIEELPLELAVVMYLLEVFWQELAENKHQKIVISDLWLLLGREQRNIFKKLSEQIYFADLLEWERANFFSANKLRANLAITCG